MRSYFRVSPHNSKTSHPQRVFFLLGSASKSNCWQYFDCVIEGNLISFDSEKLSKNLLFKIRFRFQIQFLAKSLYDSRVRFETKNVKLKSLCAGRACKTHIFVSLNFHNLQFLFPHGTQWWVYVVHMVEEVSFLDMLYIDVSFDSIVNMLQICFRFDLGLVQIHVCCL